MAATATARAPGHAAGNISAAICGAIGYPETIRIRRALSALVLLRSEQESGNPDAAAAFDALAEATDELLVRLAEAGFLA